MGWPKGKPRAVAQVAAPAGSAEERVAEYIHLVLCYIPGCSAKLHVEDARNIIALVKKEANK